MTQEADNKLFFQIGLGHVAYSDHMGNDFSIAEAARASYKKGTKSITDDVSLVRALYRDGHFSPFSMCQLKLHMKLPMFVFNQLVRHDRFHWNVESGRYSEMSNDFWTPADSSGFRSQGTSGNKQVGDGRMAPDNDAEAEKLLIMHEQSTRETYQLLLGLGVCREQARSIISVGQYIECFSTANLGDWLLMLSKRLKPDAQLENTLYASAIFDIITQLFPVVAKAFEDYELNSVTFSKLELDMLKMLKFNFTPDFEVPQKSILSEMFDQVGIISIRERASFISKIKKLC